MRAMMSRGGENPWEVEFDKSKKEQQEKAEAESSISEGGFMERASKSFSF